MYLTVDLGSTHFKAAVFDRRLRALGSGAVPVRHTYGSGGKIEFDVDRSIELNRLTIAEAMRKARIGAKSLTAVAITSQAQSFTVLGPGGKRKLPFISWQDMRAADTAETISVLPAFSGFSRHCSFTSVLPGLQLCLVKHLQDTNPGLIKAKDRILHLPSFLVFSLTGDSIIDQNLAAMSGLYSMKAGRWWQAAIEVCGLFEGQLSRVCAIGEVCGHTASSAARFGLPEGIPVVLAGNDQTSGAYGARVHENGAVLISLGTAQAAYRSSPVMPKPSRVTARGPYPGGRFYAMMVDSCGGSVINWAKNVLVGSGTHDDFFSLAAQSPPGCRGISFTPDLPLGAGSWKNIGFHHVSSDMARSVLESVVERMGSMVEQLSPEERKPPLLVAGGGSRQKLWRDMLSKRLGQPLKPVAADPLLGSARMAREALRGGSR